MASVSSHLHLSLRGSLFSPSTYLFWALSLLTSSLSKTSLLTPSLKLGSLSSHSFSQSWLISLLIHTSQSGVPSLLTPPLISGFPLFSSLPFCSALILTQSHKDISRAFSVFVFFSLRHSFFSFPRSVLSFLSTPAFFFTDLPHPFPPNILCPPHFSFLFFMNLFTSFEWCEVSGGGADRE